MANDKVENVQDINAEELENIKKYLHKQVDMLMEENVILHSDEVLFIDSYRVRSEGKHSVVIPKSKVFAFGRIKS